MTIHMRFFLLKYESMKILMCLWRLAPPAMLSTEKDKSPSKGNKAYPCLFLLSTQARQAGFSANLAKSSSRPFRFSLF